MASMQIASHARRYITPIAGVVAAVVGITTALNVSASKYAPTAGYTYKTAIILSRIVGPQATMTIMSAPLTSAGVNPNGLFLPQPGITVSGIFNSSTFAGIATLVINYVLKSFNIPYYNTYAAPFVNALGLGLTSGGVVGGLLDPDPSQMQQVSQLTGATGSFLLGQSPSQASPSQTPASYQPAPQSQPFRSVAGVRLHGR